MNPSENPTPKTLLPTRSFYTFNTIILTSKNLNLSTRQQYFQLMKKTYIPDIWMQLAIGYVVGNFLMRGRRWYKLTTRLGNQVGKFVGMVVLNQVAMFERNMLAGAFYDNNKREIDGNWGKIREQFKVFENDFYEHTNQVSQYIPHNNIRSQYSNPYPSINQKDRSKYL